MAASENKGINRRSFLKKSSIAGVSVLSMGNLLSCLPQEEREIVIARKELGTMFRTGCPAHNCGGRCLLKVYVKDNKITRIETDDRPDLVENPQLRACIRGRAYRKRQDHPDRLKYPLKRIGKRGEGKFEKISWDEATDLMASEINRIREKYGNHALLVPYGTGSYNQVSGRQTAQRLLNLVGGSLGYYNSYSTACIQAATPYIYGTEITGNQRQDWLNSKYIIMWSWNPAEMREGTNSDFYIKEARKRGAKVVCIDPRMSMSAVALADEWIPIRPGTDAALMSAMAYVIITENLHDKEFIQRYCIGFDNTQMPEGCENEESYTDYILGTKDGIPKTPEWAASITAVPASTIARIAREFATTKPAMLKQGYGMQR
ncbi:MAG: molybdopterin-dependent oxidoreductase, partial [Prolixibacteraceae bacterium]|nr:molybdopterin-dependent oxidoreductase [Prolixibacteraceae bacterium]MBN2773244.1 molybdopterin-dependent oxidoreductase [Prolixibacteraceae bacterium]